MSAAGRRGFHVLPAATPARAFAPGYQRRALIVSGFVLAGLGLLASHFPVCPMAAMFGVPCPGCGLTRATAAALHGDFHRAFSIHPLFFLVTPAYALLMAWIARDFIRGYTPGSAVHTLGPPASSTRHPALLVALTIAGGALCVLMLGLWVARFFGYFGGPVPVTTMWRWGR